MRRVTHVRTRLVRGLNAATFRKIRPTVEGAGQSARASLAPPAAASSGLCGFACRCDAPHGVECDTQPVLPARYAV